MLTLDSQPSLNVHESPRNVNNRRNSASELAKPRVRGAGHGSQATLLLLQAVMACSFQDAKEAIILGADVDDRRIYSKETFLHITVENDSYPITELLVQSGANFDAPDKTGATPVHLAACNGNENILKLLLRASANPNANTFENRTPLHLAAERGKRSTVQTLLDEVGDILDLDAIDEDGETALTLASWADSAECVKLLLEAGSDREHFTTWGNTALHHSIGKRHTEVVRELLQPRITLMEFIPHSTILNENIALTISSYCDEGIDLSVRNKQGMNCADICDENQYMEGLHLLMVYATGHGDSTDSIDKGISQFFKHYPRRTFFMKAPPPPIGFDLLLMDDESGSSLDLSDDINQQ